MLGPSTHSPSTLRSSKTTAWWITVTSMTLLARLHRVSMTRIAARTGTRRIRCANGSHLFALWRDQRAQKLAAAGGNLNPPTLTAWKDLLERERWSVVIDIGANYGEMLANVDLSPHGTILAIEPNPLVCSCLVRTVSSNRLPVTVICAALSARHGVMRLDEADSNSGLVTVAEPRIAVEAGSLSHQSGLLIGVLTLDELLEDLGVDVTEANVLIKIDVEGHESAVLAGAQKVLYESRRTVILAEALFDESVARGFELVREVPSLTQPDVTQDAVYERRA